MLNAVILQLSLLQVITMNETTKTKGNVQVLTATGNILQVPVSRQLQIMRICEVMYNLGSEGLNSLETYANMLRKESVHDLNGGTLLRH